MRLTFGLGAAAVLAAGGAIAAGTPAIQNDDYRRDPANLFVEKGYGLASDYYVGGRATANYSYFNGLYEVMYNGPKGPSTFFKTTPLNTYFQCFRLDILIDGRAWKPEFNNTEHYPFGYVSECTLDGVKLRHEFVVDNNAILRRLRVLDNPKGRKVRARISHVQWTWANVAESYREFRHSFFAPNYDGNSITATVYKVSDTNQKDANGRRIQRQTLLNTIEIGAAAPVWFPLNRKDMPAQPDRFWLTETEAAEANADHVFYLVFDRQPGEDLSGRRIDEAFARFRAQRRDTAVFNTGDRLVDSAMMSCPMISRALTVKDVPGAVRAGPYYFVWGWDGMVHSDVQCLLGHADQTRSIMDFFAADFTTNGIAGAYSKDLTSSKPKKWSSNQNQFIPVVCNGYYQLTGDEEARTRWLPMVKYIYEKTMEDRVPGIALIKCDMGYPDNPKRLKLTRDDWHVFNNIKYYQMLRACEEFLGVKDPYADEMVKAFNEMFWDEKESFWADSVDGKTGEKRPFYSSPIQFFMVSRWGTDMLKARGEADVRRVAAVIERDLATPLGIRSMKLDSIAYQCDGGHIGCCRPVLDRGYWKAQNLAGNWKALGNFRNTVARNWEQHTCPEGELVEFENEDFRTHNDCTGGKQHFAANAWPWEYLELQYGLEATKDGLRFHALGDGQDVSVENLHVRGRRLDVRLSGTGANATYVLNGERLAEGFIPWGKLKADGRNRLEITVNQGNEGECK